MRQKRKKYLKDNPDKHPWKYHDKFKSEPCEFFKKRLRDAGYHFVEEFMPLYPERNFSIDIAFPDKKIGVEINGEQHYNRDGTLKDYYRKRNRLLKNNGWAIIELHYKEVYKENIITNISIMVP